MAYILKVLTWWLASIVKFLFTPFVMMGNPGGYHWSFIEILLITSSGAALGCFIFYHFGEVIFAKWSFQSKNKKVFSPMKRRIIRLKMKYGIYGLMMISALISVPVSSLLCARFYKHDPTALSKLILGFGIWSVALTSLAYSFRLLGFEF